MRSTVFYTCVAVAAAFQPVAFRARSVAVAGKQKEANEAEAVEVQALGKGSVVEFVLNKHTVLGVIESHMVKAKGGLRYEIMTADEKVHAGIAPRDIHFSAAPLPPGKGAPAPLKRLSEFSDVLDASAVKLMDPEVLEICYEMAADEDDSKVFRVKDVAKLIDDGTAPIDLYRTFRILTSELGRVFFKAAKGEAAAFKARARKSVEAAKVSLCKAHGDDYNAEFCLV